MYTLRHVPPDRHTDARGLTLDEAFVRMMALMERHYMFVRTRWGTQLLMTNTQPGEPTFYVDMIFSAEARQEIKHRVCAHGLGLFQFMTDADYVRLIAGDVMAAQVGLKRYRGPIETVEQAMWAGMVLHINCQRCSRPHSEWAYSLCQRKPAAKTTPLNRTVGVFYCRGCKHSVEVYISARREGEL